MGPVKIDPTYSVEVDQIPVFMGFPNDCERIQRWIDEARTSRCVALYGRALPYGPPEPPG